MRFDDDLEMYVVEMEGIIFAFEEEPDEDYEDNLKFVADNYRDNLNYIIEFMLPDLQEMYGDIDIEMVKDNLGRPTIYLDGGCVDYYEQSFDDIHIFRFEFSDDEFKDLQYFSIDG